LFAKVFVVKVPFCNQFCEAVCSDEVSPLVISSTDEITYRVM